MKWYYAKFSISYPSLISFEAEKETPKTIVPKQDSKEKLMGYIYIGKRILKNDARLFPSKSSALLYLYERSEATVKALEKKLTDARETMYQLAALVREESEQ